MTASDANTDEKAIQTVREKFGSTWESTYSQGKESITLELTHTLGLRREQAVELIDRLEKDGKLTFSSEAAGGSDASTGRPATSGSGLPPLGRWSVA
jgi:hypothetical protein